MPFEPGDRIERYVIDALLGQGGMGEVYRAHDARLQRSVALKIVRLEASGLLATQRPSTDGAARMLREARAAAALDHPNVVAIYDVGQVTEPEELRGTTYLAMELIKGRPLRAFVGDASVTMAERVQWMSDVARALAAAHAAGIVHRDVKPENVMVRDDRRVKVLDFGIAKRAVTDGVDIASSTEGLVVPTVTGQGVVVGTPMYMAPEQLRGEPLDGRADQFSWGVVAYELFAGRLPWSTEGGAITLVSQILSAAPPPLEARTGLPPNVAAAVMRALSKAKSDRFATMDELLQAMAGGFSPLAQTSSISSVSPSAQAPAASGGLRTTGEAPIPRAAAGAAPLQGRKLGAIALAAAAVVGVVLVGLRERPRPSAPPGSASAASAAPPGCTSNRACSAFGEPAVCRASDHACVPIASQDCKAMYEPADLERDDTIWIGAMFPARGPDADVWGKMNLDGVDFARQEIAQATGALGSSALRARPIALVGCDDGEDAMRAARHLVNDVGVPAIVGFRSGQEVIDLAGSLLIEHGVLAVASMTSNPLITRLPQPKGEPRLVWRTTYNFESLASATAAFVHDALEPLGRGRKKTRVVLARVASGPSLAFADVFYRRLVFNGRSALDNGHDYQEVGLDSDAGGETDEVARQIAEAEPTMVVLLALPGTVLGVAEQIEARLPPGATLPQYVIVNDGTASLAPFVGSSAGRRHRVFAVNSLSNSNANARFVIRYNQARHASVSRTINPGVSYDAFYLLSYAAFALPPGAPATGVALAERFSRLIGPGKSIEVGPTGVFDALTALSGGGTIDLEGTESGLDFDLATGEAPSDFALLCPAIDEHGRATGEDVESGVVYRAKAGKAEGSLSCP